MLSSLMAIHSLHKTKDLLQGRSPRRARLRHLPLHYRLLLPE